MNEKMTAAQLASELAGGEDGDCPTKEQVAKAKESGLLIVFPYSDDNMEFRGVWEDEFGCYGGGEVRINHLGLEGFPPNSGCDPDMDNCQYCVLYGKYLKENFPHKIKAKWEDDGESDTPAWTYETEVPHETFRIMLDGDVWCRGLVINVKDLHLI